MNYPELKDWLQEITVRKLDLSVHNLAKYIKDGVYKVNNIGIINYLLSQNLQILNEILYRLGFNLCRWTFENALSLINWYLCYDIKVIITLEYRTFVSIATVDEIIQKIGPVYNGTKNYASVIFFMYTGFKAPENIDYTTTLRYQELINHNNIGNIFTYLYDAGKTISPIRYICSQKIHPLEYVFTLDDIQLYDWCLQYEVVPFKFVNIEDKINISEIYENLSIQQWNEFKEMLYQEIRKYDIKYFCKDEIKLNGNIEFHQVDNFSVLALISYFQPMQINNRTK